MYKKHKPRTRSPRLPTAERDKRRTRLIKFLDELEAEHQRLDALGFLDDERDEKGIRLKEPKE